MVARAFVVAIQVAHWFPVFMNELTAPLDHLRDVWKQEIVLALLCADLE